MNIRRAKLTDVEFLLNELKHFSQFYGSKYSLFGEDPDNNNSVLSELINNHLFLIAEKDFEPVGFMCGTLTRHSFNPKIRVQTELFWWVLPRFRMSRAGAMLFSVFMKYAEENVDWVFMNLEDNSPLKEESLLKRGFKLKEKNYLLEI